MKMLWQFVGMYDDGAIENGGCGATGDKRRSFCWYCAYFIFHMQPFLGYCYEERRI